MIVNFETAKLAKEKGYPQYNTYYGYGAKGGKTRGQLGHYPDMRMYYAAPTIFELQVWLFEEHNIWITPAIRGEYFEAVIYDLPIELGYSYESDEEYTNPFQALKEELINALKLIKS